MPHLRIRGVKPEIVQKLSAKLHEELAQIMQTTPDNFTFEHVPTQFFTRGKTEGAYPFVEVLWFERNQETKDRTAKHITERLRAMGDSEDIAVVFRPLAKADYFENGEHF